MNKYLLPGCVLCALGMLLLGGLWGCAALAGAPGKMAEYYRLEYKGREQAAQGSMSPKKILVRVMAESPVNSPKILVAEGDYRVRFAEGQRWAEPVEVALGRVIAEGLRRSFAVAEAVPVPAGYRHDYAINLKVEKLWGTVEGTAVVKLKWQISNEKEHVVAVGEYEKAERGWRQGDYAQLAERLSSLMPGVVEVLAGELSSLDGEAQ